MVNIFSEYNSYLETDDFYNLEEYLNDLKYEDMLEQKDLKKIKSYLTNQLPIILSLYEENKVQAQSVTLEFFYRALKVLKKYSLEPEINNFVKKVEKKLSSKIKIIAF